MHIHLSMTPLNKSNMSSTSHLLRSPSSGVYLSIPSAECSLRFRVCSRLDRRVSTFLFASPAGSYVRITSNYPRVANQRLRSLGRRIERETRGREFIEFVLELTCSSAP